MIWKECLNIRSPIDGAYLTSWITHISGMCLVSLLALPSFQLNVISTWCVWLHIAVSHSPVVAVLCWWNEQHLETTLLLRSELEITYYILRFFGYSAHSKSSKRATRLNLCWPLYFEVKTIFQV